MEENVGGRGRGGGHALGGEAEGNGRTSSNAAEKSGAGAGVEKPDITESAKMVFAYQLGVLGVCRVMYLEKTVVVQVF